MSCRPCRLAPLLVVFFLLAACAARRPPAGDRSDAGTAVARLLERASRPDLFDGELRVAGRYRGERLRARLLAVLRAGGSFYLESLEGESFVVAADGDEVRAILPGERRWLRAAASAATLDALVGLDLDPAELAAVVAGVGATPAMLREAHPEGCCRLIFPAGHLDLEDGSLEPVAGELRGIRFWREHGGREVRIESRARSLELRLRLYAAAGAGHPRPELFRPEPPPGFGEVALGEVLSPLLLPEEKKP